jgi:lysozyme
VNHYLRTINPVEGERVVIDYEEAGCTLDGLHDAVQALIDHGMDLQIAVYSGHLLKDQLGTTRDEYLAENTSLWLAQYTTGEPSWPHGTWPAYSLWQYTDDGNVGGIKPCDCNRFNGSDEQLLAWIRPAGAPEPSRDFIVNVTIEVPEGVTVNVKVVEV